MNAYMVAFPKGRYWSAFRSHRNSCDRIDTTATRSLRTSQVILTQQSKPRPQTKEKKRQHSTEPNNYIQLIKRPLTQIDILQKKYTRSLDCINILGTMVSKSIEFLDALRNFWIIPLFLMFKRMVQLRIEVERFLEAQINSYNIENWKEVCNSREYLLFLSKIKSDNRVVRDELKLLLEASLPKTKCLDKIKRERVLYFLNDNLEANIKAVCLSYMKDQLLILVRQRKGICKKPIEWLKLQLCVQASIFIAQQPVLVCESGHFSYDMYTKCQKSDDSVLISQYIEKLIV